jgi:hypothetical protein
MSAMEQTAAPPAPGAAPPSASRSIPAAVWVVLGVLIVAVAVHNVFDTGGHRIFEWLNDAVVVAATVLTLARGAQRDPVARAWRWVGAGLVCWTLADVLFSALYDGRAHPPYPSVSDAFWVAWYPLTAIGGWLLIKGHLQRFELHRWMDGLAVMLVVLTAGAAIFLEPALEHTHDSLLTTVVDFSYPVMDVLFIGGVLGVYSLLGWRPGRTWHLLGLGLVIMVFADAAFAVQEARGTPLDSQYEFAWTLGVVLIARAAWTSAAPGTEQPRVYGWRAVALPLAGQLLAAAIQVAGMINGSVVSERVLTLAVLLIASLQIAVSRPRAPGEARLGEDQPQAGVGPS